MKVLVVGGAGYIGAHVCKSLAARGDEPIVFDNLSSGHAHAVKWGRLVEGDIRSADDLDRALSDVAPDGVMHFAADIEVGAGQRFPVKFWENNVAGVITLLGAMQRAGVKPLVFSSTCAVYGEPRAVPITEAEPCKPVSVYGRTKRAVEHLLEDTARVDGVRYAALRYFNAAGASPDGEIGEEHDPETHLIPNAIAAAAGRGPKLKIFGSDYPTQDGTAVRDYVHVSDLADAHIAALQRLMAGRESFVCNLGTGEGASVRQVIETIERIAGRPVPHDLAPRREGDAVRLVADPTAARDLLGWTPRYSDLETIVAHAWRFHAARWGLA